MCVVFRCDSWRGREMRLLKRLETHFVAWGCPCMVLMVFLAGFNLRSSALP